MSTIVKNDPARMICPDENEMERKEKTSVARQKSAHAVGENRKERAPSPNM